MTQRTPFKETKMMPIILLLLVGFTFMSSFGFAPLPVNNAKNSIIISRQNRGGSSQLNFQDDKTTQTTIDLPSIDDTMTTTKNVKTEDEEQEEYWFNPLIHTLGNTGIGGGAHAAVGAISTKIIDNSAYRGRDIRRVVSNQLAQRVIEAQQQKNVERTTVNADIRVLDMCCGVGMSTRALQNAFANESTASTTYVTGVDTSPEMIEMGQMLTIQEKEYELATKPIAKGGHGLLHRMKYYWNKTVRRMKRGRPLNRQIEAAELSNITFYKGNAESTPFPSETFDLVTVFYSFHEIPYWGRESIIDEARRVLKKGGMLAIVDISRQYVPSKPMLAGEPYVLEYQHNINDQLHMASSQQGGFTNFTNEIIVDGHVELWTLTRT